MAGTAPLPGLPLTALCTTFRRAGIGKAGSTRHGILLEGNTQPRWRVRHMALIYYGDVLSWA